MGKPALIFMNLHVKMTQEMIGILHQVSKHLFCLWHADFVHRGVRSVCDYWNLYQRKIRTYKIIV